MDMDQYAHTPKKTYVYAVCKSAGDAAETQQCNTTTNTWWRGTRGMSKNVINLPSKKATVGPPKIARSAY